MTSSNSATPEAGLAQRGHGPAKADPDLVALDQALQPHREQQVALLDAIPLEVVEQPAGPGDPAATTGDLAAVEHAEGQPERAPDRSLHAALAQERMMRTRPTSAPSSSLPIRYAAVASRSRSSASSGDSRSAADNCAKASAHARRSNDSRPRSSASAAVIRPPRRQAVAPGTS